MKSTTTFTILCAMLVCNGAAASALRGTTSDTALSDPAGPDDNTSLITEIEREVWLVENADSPLCALLRNAT